MSFCDDLIAGIKSSYGYGTPFENYTELARHCGVSPTQMFRYINGKSQSTLTVIGKILDGIGAKIIFPSSHVSNNEIEQNFSCISKERDEYKSRLEKTQQELFRAQGEIAALEKQLARLTPTPEKTASPTSTSVRPGNSVKAV